MAISCNVEDLNNAAKCFQCLSLLELESASAYLTCQIADMCGPPTIIDNIDISTLTQPLNALHGLGALPSRVSVVLKITTPVGGYSTGDELPYRNLSDNTDPSQFFLSWGVNATRVWISLVSGIDTWPGAIVIDKGGGSNSGVVGANMVAKVYLWK